LGEQHRSLSSSLCSFLHSPVTSSLLGPNILLNTLFLSADSQNQISSKSFPIGDETQKQTENKHSSALVRYPVHCRVQRTRTLVTVAIPWRHIGTSTRTLHRRTLGRLVPPTPLRLSHFSIQFNYVCLPPLSPLR